MIKSKLILGQDMEYSALGPHSHSQSQSVL